MTNDIVLFTIVSFQMCVSLKKIYTLMSSECCLSVTRELCNKKKIRYSIVN